MQAYSSALNEGGTSMVLSPNSDFFRYFRNPLGPGAQDGDTARQPTLPQSGAQTSQAQ